MRRFFVNTPLEDEIIVSGPDAHHMVHVLRMKAGDRVLVSDRRGQTGEAVIAAIDGDQVRLSLLVVAEDQQEPPIRVWLGQGLPKSDKMDFIVQKAVELGVYAVLPIITENIVVKYDRVKQSARRDRWQKIAQEAAKQSKRSRVPAVYPVAEWSDAFAAVPETAVQILLYENEHVVGLKSVLTAHAAAEDFVLWIGPEGGFSAAEVKMAQARGSQIVTMGPRILRTETAGPAALAAVMYECGDLGGRPCREQHLQH